jgi:hypothetical protein
MQLDPNDLLIIDCEAKSAMTNPEEAALAKADRAAQARISGVVIGKFTGWDSTGQVVVDYPGNPSAYPLPAVSAAPVDSSAVGRDAALMFVQGDRSRPILIGLIERPLIRPQPLPATQSAEVDGKQLIFTAGEKIIFQCGKASITLTKEGKVLIRGAYLLSRSSGVNRIKGGSVQIN